MLKYTDSEINWELQLFVIHPNRKNPATLKNNAKQLMDPLVIAVYLDNTRKFFAGVILPTEKLF